MLKCEFLTFKVGNIGEILLGGDTEDDNCWFSHLTRTVSNFHLLSPHYIVLIKCLWQRKPSLNFSDSDTILRHV